MAAIAKQRARRRLSLVGQCHLAVAEAGGVELFPWLAVMVRTNLGLQSPMKRTAFCVFMCT